MEVVGRMRVSGGVRGRKCSFFSPGFCGAGESKASHVASFFVSRRSVGSVRLEHPAACQTPLSPAGLVLSRGGRRAGAGPALLRRDHRALP